jgi:hypothetical protein
MFLQEYLMIYRCLSLPNFRNHNRNGTNLTLTEFIALNNKSFKTGAEVEPASISNKIPKDSVS